MKNATMVHSLQIVFCASFLMAISIWGCGPAGPPSQYPDALLLAISQDSEAAIAAAIKTEPRLVKVSLVNGQTPFYYAIRYRKLNAAAALLAAGADPAQLSSGISPNTVDSPLLLAVRICNLDLVEMILCDDTLHFFSERDLADAIMERRWQANCSPATSASIAAYVSSFLRRIQDAPSENGDLKP